MGFSLRCRHAKEPVVSYLLHTGARRGTVKIFRTALVGLGLAGKGLGPKGFAESHAGALTTQGGFELVAAVDPSETARLGLKALLPKVSVYSEPEELEDDLRLDLLVLAEPPDRRLANVIKLLQNFQPSAVLLEKPVAQNLDHAKRIVELLTEAGVSSFVSFPRRADSMTRFLKKEFFSGNPGAPPRGHIWYSKHPLNSAIHFLNLVDYWAGPMLTSSLIRSGEDVNRPHFMVEGNSSTFIFSPTPAAEWVHYSVDVMLAGGRLRYDYGGSVIEFNSPKPRAEEDSVVELTPQVFSLNPANRFVQMYQEIHHALSGGRNEYALTTGTEALRQQKLIDRILPR